MKTRKIFLRAIALSMMVAGLSGCDPIETLYGDQSQQQEEQKEEKAKTLSISLSAPEGVSEVHRHEKVQLTPHVENGKVSDLTYHIVGSASVSESGLVTISDDAAVGSTVGVYAKIGDVQSNFVEFTVGQTLPETMTLQASKSVLKNGEIVVFSAGFLPVYATAKDFTLTITGGEDLAEVSSENPHAVQLKANVDADEHTSETVQVTAKCTQKDSVTATMNLQVGDPSAVKVSIAAQGAVTQLGRHESVQINPTLTNAELADVSYVVLGACSVTSSGLLTVNDDAIVGNTVGVYAMAKGVQSNILQFTVKHTAPTTFVVNPTKSILLNGEQVEFVATFEPTYTTLKEYTLEVTSGGDLAQVSDSNPHAVELKDGVNTATHDGDIVTVTATATGNTELTSVVNLTIKQYSGDEVLISIAAQGAATQLERHESITIVPTLTNAETSDVTYHVTGSADITSAGVLTVSDTAAVGSTISVYAIAKGVVSNTLVFSVKDTTPADIQLSANKSYLKTGETVSFSAEFVPTYTTLTDFSLSITSGMDIAEICPSDLHSIQLKEGVDHLDYVGLDKTITVEATSASANIKDEVVINVGLESASLNVHPVVVLVGRDDTDNLLLNVDVYDETGHLIDVENSRFSFSSSNTGAVEVEASTGRLIPVGHGTSTVTVTFGDLDTKTANITVLVPPTDMDLTGYNNTILRNGLHTGRGEANKIDSPFVASRDDAYTFSQNIDYKFTMYDELELPVADRTPSENIGSVVNGKIIFGNSVSGKVVVTATSNSTIGSEKATGYEATKDMIFNVNAGKNVYTQGQAYFALRHAELEGINFMNDIYLDHVIEEVEGEDTFQSYYVWNEHHESYKGFRSFGDKIIQGNGVKISLEDLPIANNRSEDISQTAYEGPGVFEFYPYDFDDSIFDPENAIGDLDHDIICHPYHVEMYDLSIIGNVNVTGEYVGNRPASEYSEVDMKEKRFVRTYKHALNVGYKNNAAGFMTLSGNVSTRFYQACANAYIDAPIFKNISIQGFDTGATFLHVVNGYVENLHVSDCYEHGIETNQCIMEFHDTSFGQVGGFGIEVAPHGVDTSNAPDYKWCVAGKNYDQKPRIVMSGSISSTNLNNGDDTPHMSTYKVKGYTITQVIQAVIMDLATVCANELAVESNYDSDYVALADNSSAQYGLAFTELQTVLGQTLFNQGFGSRINFFSFIFMLDYATYGKTAEDVAEFTCNVSGGSTNLISLKDLVKNCLRYGAKGNHYTDFANCAYIQVEVTGESLGVYVGQVLAINNAYAG